MSAPITPLASTPVDSGRARREATLEHGGFGLDGPRLVIEPGTSPDELLWDALCLVHSALGVFDSILAGGGIDDHDLPESYFAGLYVLRQACIVLNAAQLTPAQGAAAAASGAGAHGVAAGGAQ